MEKSGKTQAEKALAYDGMVEFLSWYHDYAKKVRSESTDDNDFYQGLLAGKADSIEFLLLTFEEKNFI